MPRPCSQARISWKLLSFWLFATVSYAGAQTNSGNRYGAHALLRVTPKEL